MSRHRLHTILALAVIMGLAVPSAYAAGATPPRWGIALLADDTPVSFSISDAAMPAAIRALKEQTGLVARIQGPAPEAKITLAVKDTPIHDLLSAVAAAYGRSWECRLTMIVFTPQNALGPDIPAQERWDARRLEGVLEELRALGLGEPATAPGSSAEQTLTPDKALRWFTVEQARRMAQAGPRDARRYGVRIGDLSREGQQGLLGWLRAGHDAANAQRVSSTLSPFDPARYLDAILYVTPSTVQQGGPPEIEFDFGRGQRGR